MMQFLSPIARREAPLLKKWAKYLPLLFIASFIIFKSTILAVITATLLFINHRGEKNSKNNDAAFIFLPWLAFSFLILIDILFRGTSPRSFDVSHKILIAFLFYHLLPILRLREVINYLVYLNFAFFAQAIYQVFYLKIDRATGVLKNAIIFGDFAILNSILIIIYMIYQTHSLKKINIRYLIFLSSGAAAGLIAAIYSQTRSALLVFGGFIFYFLFFIVQQRKKNNDLRAAQPKKSTFLKLIFISSLLLSMAAVIFLSYDIFLLKIQESMYEIQKIQQGQYHHSLGLRLEMWRLSLEGIMQKPFWGMGFDQFFEKIFKNFHQGCSKQPNLYCPAFNHPHNELLWFLVNWGIVGAISFFSIFIGPYYFFKKQKNIFYKKNDSVKLFMAPRAFNNHSTCEIKQIMVNCTLIAYFCFGLTQAMFAHQQGVLFFLLIITLLAKIKDRITNI